MEILVILTVAFFLGTLVYTALNAGKIETN